MYGTSLSLTEAISIHTGDLPDAGVNTTMYVRGIVTRWAKIKATVNFAVLVAKRQAWYYIGPERPRRGRSDCPRQFLARWC